MKQVVRTGDWLKKEKYMEALQNSEYCAYFDLVELGVVPASGATE